MDSNNRSESDQTPPDPLALSRPKVTGRTREAVIGVDRLVLGLTRRWIAIVSLVVGLYAGLPFVAPIAMQAGQEQWAAVIYNLYRPVCHQFAFRSWFLFGPQTVYPRERAGVPGVGTFEQYASQEPFFQGVDVRTLDPVLTIKAKDFIGSERMGWKVAFCQRDVAIYGAIALFGVVYGVIRMSGKQIPYLPFWAYLLLAIVPIGLDGFSQLFANPPFTTFLPFSYPIRESTPFLRVLTGSLFGVGNAWLAFPYIEESMQETRQNLEDKLTRAGIIGGVGRT